LIAFPNRIYNTYYLGFYSYLAFIGQSRRNYLKIENEFAAEYKLDGERAQIHKKNNKIILFSRSLENITEYYPDIVENI